MTTTEMKRTLIKMYNDNGGCFDPDELGELIKTAYNETKDTVRNFRSWEWVAAMMTMMVEYNPKGNEK